MSSTSASYFVEFEAVAAHGGFVVDKVALGLNPSLPLSALFLTFSIFVFLSLVTANISP